MTEVCHAKFGPIQKRSAGPKLAANMSPGLKLAANLGPGDRFWLPNLVLLR